MGSKKLQVWLPMIFAVVMIAGMAIGYQLRENVTGGSAFLKNAKGSSLEEVMSLVNNKYVDDISKDSLQNETISDLLSHLDPHSVYIPASELEEVNEDLQGNFEGIGVEFQIFNDTVNVVNVVENGPSAKAGIELGDQIIKVNDTASLTKKNISAEEIRKLLRGQDGSTVKVTVERNDSLKNIIIKRGIIPVPSVDVAYMIDAQTGFIRINKFAETTYGEFMNALQKLQKQGMQKMILDLRGNGGGYLDQAVDIADQFLDGDKLIVYTKGAHAERTEYHCRMDGLFEKGKVVVLVDETTASASEILSGALQDWDRATLIGRRTFGKGLVQQQFGLSDGSALRLTIARYYTPVGRNIQKPYNKGKEEYEQDLVNRFHDGEMTVGDTSKPVGKAFKTASGRLVYGGGGITPDIFMPFDTTAQPKPILEMYMKGTINTFIYNYYRANKNMFQNAASPEAFSKQHVAGEQDWQALQALANKDSIDISKVPAIAKADLLTKLTAYLAREKWRSEGFFEVANQTDPMVKKALDVLK